MKKLLFSLGLVVFLAGCGNSLREEANNIAENEIIVQVEEESEEQDSEDLEESEELEDEIFDNEWRTEELDHIFVTYNFRSEANVPVTQFELREGDQFLSLTLEEIITSHNWVHRGEVVDVEAHARFSGELVVRGDLRIMPSVYRGGYIFTVHDDYIHHFPFLVNSWNQTFVMFHVSNIEEVFDMLGVDVSNRNWSDFDIDMEFLNIEVKIDEYTMYTSIQGIANTAKVLEVISVDEDSTFIYDYVEADYIYAIDRHANIGATRLREGDEFLSLTLTEIINSEVMLRNGEFFMPMLSSQALFTGEVTFRGELRIIQNYSTFPNAISIFINEEYLEKFPWFFGEPEWWGDSRNHLPIDITNTDEAREILAGIGIIMRDGMMETFADIEFTIKSFTMVPGTINYVEVSSIRY
ncbi:MAG: hypothetical protein FWD82_06295 [Defluviitaleaceae bacterium]|nr:hypothetical protein [Defluviitaleaceae bacterium]